VHISVLSNKFVKDPREVVKAGDVVKVKVLEVDQQRKRIALSMRLDEAPQARRSGEKRTERRPGENRGQATGSRPGESRGPGSASPRSPTEGARTESAKPREARSQEKRAGQSTSGPRRERGRPASAPDRSQKPAREPAMGGAMAEALARALKRPVS